MTLKTAAVLIATLVITVNPVVAQRVMAQNATKTLTAHGVVKSVTDSSLTIEAGGKKSLTFAVDSATRVLRPGAASTASRNNTAATGLVIGDVVRRGDRVTVRYQQLGSTVKATEVRVGSR